MPNDLSLSLSFFSYAIIGSITPGPNNMMLTSMALHKGFKATIPTMFGVSLGHALQVIVCSLGLGAAIIAVPGLRPLLTVIGVVYLLFLAWKITFTTQLSVASTHFGFWQAAAFQWINPKALSLALTTAALFIPLDENGFNSFTPYRTALAYALVNLPCIACWGLLGDKIRLLINQDNGDDQKRNNYLLMFNRIAGSILALTAVWLLFSNRMVFL